MINKQNITVPDKLTSYNNGEIYKLIKSKDIDWDNLFFENYKYYNILNNSDGIITNSDDFISVISNVHYKLLEVNLKIYDIYKVDLGLRLCVNTNELCYSDELDPNDTYKTIYFTDRNIGANSPYEPGLYFAWGDTNGYKINNTGVVEKYDFSWKKYKYGIINHLYKYTNNEYCDEDYVADNKTILDKEDDGVINYMYGSEKNIVKTTDNGYWRLPKSKEIEMLLNPSKFDILYINIIGEVIDVEKNPYSIISGVKIVSKLTEKEIFIPAAGYCTGILCYKRNNYCDIWCCDIVNSPNLNTIDYNKANQIHIEYNSGIKINNDYRYIGKQMRGVIVK